MIFFSVTNGSMSQQHCVIGLRKSKILTNMCVINVFFQFMFLLRR
jgi:hypothetical protein